MNDFFAHMAAPGPATATIDGVAVGRGSRVRLRPRPGGDLFDLALAGRTAVVEGVDEDDAGTLRVAVTLDDDPGRDLGAARQPGHRFFFALDEVDPLGDAAAVPARARILVAGIGNVFLGDDGFGVEVARRLAGRLGPVAEVADFGIRGMDLAYAMQDDYAAVILVDAVARGGAPGTVYVIEAAEADTAGDDVLDTHGMNPVRVLRLARALGRVPLRTLVVGCEPARTLPADTSTDVLVELSPPVLAAVDEAVRVVATLVTELGDKEACR